MNAKAPPASPPRLTAAPSSGSSVRGFYLLIMFAAFALDSAFVFTFIVNPVDYCLTAREAIDYVDVSFVWVRLLGALAAAASGFAGFSLALQPVRMERRMERALSVLACQALAALSASSGLLGPGSDARRDGPALGARRGEHRARLPRPL